MHWLTEDAELVCNHELGRIANEPGQDLVTVERRRVLVATDPEGRAIRGCPNIGATIRPCLRTLRVDAGYSTWLTIEGRSICLDTVTGYTDGTPPGVVTYHVRRSGQHLVSEAG
jgi:hypothetical protein